MQYRRGERERAAYEARGWAGLPKREATQENSAAKAEMQFAETDQRLIACFIFCRWMCLGIGPCRVLVLACRFSIQMARACCISLGASTRGLVLAQPSSTTCSYFSFVTLSSGDARQLEKGFFLPRQAKSRPFQSLARICWARQLWAHNSTFRSCQVRHALAALRRSRRFRR
jgi:hypothetical protein